MITSTSHQAAPSAAANIETRKSSKAASSKTGHPKDIDRRLRRLDSTMKRHQYKAEALIIVLHAAQDAFGYLEEEVLAYIARGLKLPLSQVYGVATFYHLFSLKPSGDHSCVVCMGTACYVKGGGKIMDDLQAELNIQAGETTADGKISLMAARCLGACGIAPAVVLDDTVMGKQDSQQILAKVKSWENE